MEQVTLCLSQVCEDFTYIRVNELRQKITFSKEEKNPHDRFAVAGKAMLKGKLCPVTVGHVPREMSLVRYNRRRCPLCS